MLLLNSAPLFGGSGLAGPSRCEHSGLHQFNAYTVRRRDVAQQAAVYALLQLDGKGYAFAAQLVSEACEIALV